MKFRGIWFNSIFFAWLLLAALSPGCKSTGDKGKDEKKVATTLRFYMETNPQPGDRTMTVVVGRSAPFALTVENRPFLTETYVVRATLVDGLGGPEIRIELDRQGSWLFEQYTTANKGKRIAIFSQFGEDRWLAAPRITQRVADGVFTFTPDANQTELKRILHGLANVAEEVKKER